MDFWSTMNGGFAIEWWVGAYAHEIVDKLWELSNDVENEAIFRRGDIVISPGYGDLDMKYRVFLLVCGVAVELRSQDPVGADVARKRSFDAAFADCDAG